MDINKDPRTGDRQPRPNFNSNIQSDQHGKCNYSSESEFIEAVKVLTKRGYGFQVPGRVLVVPIPPSDFYGICWGLSDQAEREPVWFFTTKPDVYAAYQR